MMIYRSREVVSEHLFLEDGKPYSCQQGLICLTFHDAFVTFHVELPDTQVQPLSVHNCLL
jgi:hypothetical protein